MLKILFKSKEGKLLKSIWNSTEIEQKKSLNNSLEVQTVVIGAGMAGILTAYFLQKKGQKVIIVEAKTIASGQTQNTTAKITSQHGMFYNKLIKNSGMKKAKAYALAHEQAIHMYEQLIEEEKIECHFEKLPAYLYTVHDERKEELKKEAHAAEILGIKSYFVQGRKINELPFEVSGAVCFENQAQFNPLEFIKHLADKLEIYENTKVLSVKKHMVFTDKGNIRAENIVFASHYPFVNIPGFYFLRQHQERSYVLALKGAGQLSAIYYSIDENGLSLRKAQNMLLLGGGKHRTGKKMSCEDTKFGYTYLRKIAQKYYPYAQEAASWSAQDCMPHDEMPFIGKYSILRPYWYVETGFKKWGMTSSMVAAIIISSQISGIYDESENIFTPQRFLFRAGVKNLAIDLGQSILGLTKGLFGKKERKCPHMGCRLEWNKEEKSWDCPCHGSRFTDTGNLKDNPSQIDLNDKK